MDLCSLRVFLDMEIKRETSLVNYATDKWKAEMMDCGLSSE